MASTDWTIADDSLGSGSVKRGVSAGFTPPPGGGSFVYGFASKDTSIGAVALFVNLGSFAPMAKGGKVTGAMKRAPGGGPTGFSPFLFIGLQGTSVDDEGYMLGLCDEDPSRIVLRKGALSGGLPAVAPGGSGVLRRSTASFAQDVWKHLRLDMISEVSGDTRLQVFVNDLDAHNLGTAPTWTAIPGMDEFVDDALGVNSGSAPFSSGRIGFGFRTSDVTRNAYFDHIETFRQL